MAALEFKFSSDQQHQLEAIEATCDLFRGQQFIGSVFSADSGRKGQTAIGELMVGHGNELRVAPGQLLDNLHAVQEEGCLPATDVLTDGRACETSPSRWRPAPARPTSTSAPSTS